MEKPHPTRKLVTSAPSRQDLGTTQEVSATSVAVSYYF